jgi:hypothetical protein
MGEATEREVGRFKASRGLGVDGQAVWDLCDRTGTYVATALVDDGRYVVDVAEAIEDFLSVEDLLEIAGFLNELNVGRRRSTMLTGAGLIALLALGVLLIVIGFVAE